MQAVLTTAGKAAVLGTVGPVPIPTFRLGSGVSYIPVETDTALHGSVVYTGTPTAGTPATGNLYRYSIILAPSVGPLTFGEIALYMGNGSLFALAAFDEALTKQAVSNSTNGQGLRIDVFIDATGSTTSIYVDTANSDNKFEAPSVNSIDSLPSPLATNNNLYVVQDPLDPKQTHVATSVPLSPVWAISDFFRQSTNQAIAASTTSVTVSGILPSFPALFSYLQFEDGNLAGVSRLIFSYVLSGGNTVLNFQSALTVAPVVGCTLSIYSKASGFIRPDGSIPFAGNQSMAGYRLINLGAPAANSDAATKSYVDQVASSGIGGTVIKPDGTVAFSANQSMGGYRLTNLAAPSQANDAASKNYVDTSYTALVGGAPVQLDTLNKIAVALNGDASVFNTLSTAINLRTRADGTVAFTGNQSMGGYKLTNLSAPTAGTDAATKSYVDGLAAGSFKADGSVTATANWNLGNFRITSLGSPASDTDAATKGYVDSADSRLAWKLAVRVASTTNINLSSPGASIDGVTLAAGNSFLAKNQSTASENGIYVWNGASVAATRRSDFTSNTAVTGSTVFVSEGTVNAGKNYQLTTSGALTIGSTALTFGLLQGAAGAGGGTGDIRSDGSVAFAANQSMGGNKLTNLGAPASNSDATTKTYVDTSVAGASNAVAAKLFVRAASTANVNLAAPGATLDGVTLSSNDSVLLKNQSTAAENGLYTWTGSAAALTRRADFASGTAATGALVYVAEGSTNGGKFFVHTTTGAITVGSTALTFNALLSNNVTNGDIRSDGTVAFAANQSVGGYRLTSVGNATVSTDAANKLYVDSAAVGITLLAPVKVVVSTNVNLAAPGATLDGVSMANGDSFLLVAQSAAAQNGIYTWNGASSAATRRSDFNSSGSIRLGCAVTVTAGTGIGQVWVNVTAGDATPDTTALTFIQYLVGRNFARLPRVYVNTAASDSLSLDVSRYDEFRLTLTGNVTVTFTNAIDGVRFMVKVKQDGTGGRTYSHAASPRYGSGATPYTASSTAGAVDKLGYQYDGADGKYDLLAIQKALT